MVSAGSGPAAGVGKEQSGASLVAVEPADHYLSLLASLALRSVQAATSQELAFIMVNETIALAPYRQAVLWSADSGVRAVSGVAMLESGAPFLQWLERICRHQDALLDAPRQAGAESLEMADREEWAEWLPAQALWLPLITPGSGKLGLLLLAREEPWSEAEIILLGQASGVYSLALASFRRCGWHWPKAWWRGSWRRSLWLLPVLLLFLPVRLTVLAPGEVVARDPVVVRAPLEGVVERVMVQPNQPVVAGQLLFQLDTTTLRGRLEVATKTLDTARAEYERTVQQAFLDVKAKGELAVIDGRIQERRAEIDSLEEQLARSQVKAEREGVAILDDPTEWLGRPVTVGEKVLALADPRDTEVEAWLSVDNAIDLEPESPVTLFLNVDPLNPVYGRLRYVAYEAMQRPNEVMAHRVRADLLPDGSKPRMGLKGIARLTGQRVFLAYWLFRRPGAVIRQTLGW